MRGTVLLVLALVGCADPVATMPEPYRTTGGAVSEAPLMTHLVLTGTMGTGTYFYQLPAAAGTIGNPPSLICLTRDPETEYWGIVGVVPRSEGECGFEYFSSTGPLRVYMKAPPGWVFQIVVRHR